jgi:hypothetical protein
MKWLYHSAPSPVIFIGIAFSVVMSLITLVEHVITWGRWFLFKLHPVSLNFRLEEFVKRLDDNEYLLCELLMQNESNVDIKVSLHQPIVISPKGVNIRIVRTTDEVSYKNHPGSKWNITITEFFPFRLELKAKTQNSRLICLHLIGLPKSILLVEVKISTEDVTQRKYSKKRTADSMMEIFWIILR